MSRILTKNANWVVLWLKIQPNTALALPYESIINCGRWPYHTDVRQVMNEYIDLQSDKLLAFKSYYLDVYLFPYAKQHEQVTKIATRWFKSHGAII